MAATILAARSSLDGRRAGLVRRTVAEVAAGVQVLLGAAVVLIAAGSISAAPAHQQRVSLDFLAPGRTYALHLVRDNGSGGLTAEDRTVRSGDSLAVAVESHGGFTAEPTPQG